MSAISFAAPSARASGADLAVSISPLGLVELADEEFEVHGPRLNRYATNWAWYLGHHYSVAKPAGDNNLTFNYVRAFSDYTTNFCFARGVEFTTSKMYQHIVPSLYKRIWETDNDKMATLMEIGQGGSVSGDVFVKVAYEEAWTDPAGQVHPGRVCILPLNPQHCFPEFHPHDRNRLVRFKLKYRFWSTTADGTRQVFTYTEVMTDEAIEEYLNDELIDSRPNPLGQIPIAFTPNFRVSGSPWGLSDIGDIIGLNREFNEKASDISDIINYHAAPVTIIKGAKPGSLEKGANKVWGGLPKDAEVHNLEGMGDLAGSMGFLETLKRAMHEMTGVPESALGQMQPISNTAGVALAIMFQPMMQRWNHKKLTYGALLKKINRLALETLFLMEPNTLYYDPQTDGIIQEGQPEAIDPRDPLVFEHNIEWAPPLPVDALLKLQEMQMKMAMGLESKRGAIRELGNAFPDEKQQEIFEEMVADAKYEGALALLKAQFASAITAATGMVPGADGSMEPLPPAPAPTGDSGSEGAPAPGPMAAAPNPLNSMEAVTAEGQQQALAEIVTQAYGTRAGMRKMPTGSN
ncbi:phage portal protein [Terracoccus sp. 273MFTsu3.1]|uniref:phage portal protein n=1 Tax=Terracoccus sp. 273MFTsu3.1 TaxID=1172188 RepID=UPI000363D3C7|nr:phage portal protein [Terracoccus sp. 273MFTsu3.1]